MLQNPFFTQLRQEFQNDPYRDRFLAELEDHLEDLVEGEKLPPKSLNLNFMEKHFGDPKQIKKDFNAIVRPWEKILFFSEGLFYGILILFFSFIGVTVFKDLFLNQPSFHLGVLFVCIAWFFLYLLGFRRYLQFQVDFKFDLLVWLFLMIGPTLIHTLLFFADASSLSLVIYPESSMDHLNFRQFALALGSFSAAHSFLIYLAWKLQSPAEKKGQFKPPVKWLKQFRTFLFVYIAAFIVYRTIGTYFDFHNFYGTKWMWLNNLFLPLIFIEWFLSMVFSSSFGNQGQANLFLSLYFPALFLVFLALQSLVMLVQQKTWKSRRFLIVLYVASLLFIKSGAYVLDPDYQVPSISISEIAEKKQAKLFYPAMKYFNRDEGLLFYYKIQNVPSLKNDFYFGNNTAALFYVNPEALLKGDESELFLGQKKLEENASREDGSIYPEEGEGAIGKKLVCEKIPDDFILNSPEEEKKAPTIKVPLMKGDESYLYSCQKLLLNDQVISESRLTIRDWRFSPDGNWLLLVLSTGAYDPDEVHLLDLRGLKKSK